MPISKKFMIAKLRCRYALDIVEQKKIGIQGGVDERGFFEEDVMGDVSSQTLRFSSKAELALFLRKTPPRDNNQIYRMRDLDLTGVDLSGAKFAGIEFFNCTLDDANFTGVHMPRSRVFDCSLRNADFSNANLIAAAFADLDMTQATIAGASVSGMHVNRCTNPPDFKRGNGGEQVHPNASTYTGARKLRAKIPFLRA